MKSSSKRGSSAVIDEDAPRVRPDDFDSAEGATRSGPASGNLREVFASWPIVKVPVEAIERKNPSRIASPTRTAKLAMIAETMKVVGQLQAACGWKAGEDDYRLVFGFGRLEAARLAKLTHLDVRLAPIEPDDRDKEALRGIENDGRIELSPAERALQVSNMVNACLGKGVALDPAIAMTAEIYQMELRAVRDCVYIIERLADKTRSLMAEGKVNLSQARVLAKFGATATQEKYAKQVADATKPPDSQFSANAGRGGRVVSPMEIEGWLQTEKASLSSVPWKLELPMKTGVEGCDNCAPYVVDGTVVKPGCRFNSATDVTLFDTGKDEAEKGCCVNPRGFEAKQRLVAREIDKGVVKLQQSVKKKELTKDEAAGAAAVRDAIPAFVKEGSAQRKARQELGLADKPKPKTRESDGRPAQTAELKAAVAYGDAHRRWADDVSKSLLALLKKNAAARAAWRLMELSRDYYHLPTEYSTKVEKPTEKPMPPSAMATLKIVEAVVVGEEVEELPKLAEPVDHWGVRLGDRGPEFITQVAKAFGIKVDAAPEWQSFFTGKDAPKGDDAGTKKGAGKKVKKSGGGGGDTDDSDDDG